LSLTYNKNTVFYGVFVRFIQFYVLLRMQRNLALERVNRCYYYITRELEYYSLFCKKFNFLRRITK
jgi:hypothetical protein